MVTGGQGDRYEIRLPPLASSVGLARSFVSAVLDAVPGSDLARLKETMALLVSELATNAVLHARTPFTVSVQVSDGCVRAEVADGSPIVPMRRGYSRTASTGRGIAIVEDLATEVGVDLVSSGKVVWVELARHRARPVVRPPVAGSTR